MISLKSYLSRDPEVETTYRRIIGLFLQGIALHSVEGDKADHERFTEDIERCLASLSPETPVSELLVVVGGALRAMEDYNQRTSKFVRRQNTELQNMVSMLTETIITIGASSDQSVTRLQSIERSIESTQAVEDIQILKLRLSECLEAVRDEAVRQQRDGRDALENLKRELESSQELMGSVKLQSAADEATGLPDKGAADRAIRAAMESPQGKFMLVAVCNRVQAVNARFGYSVGDKILAAFAAHLKKSLSASDQIYRWQGPSFVALLERGEKMERVRAEVRQFADVRLDKTVEVAQRTVLIPISCVWAVFPVTPPLVAFLKQVETFTAAQVPRDYA
jgi:diguanylate cyclase (GGDEF)-like protein